MSNIDDQEGLGYTVGVKFRDEICETRPIEEALRPLYVPIPFPCPECGARLVMQAKCADEQEVETGDKRRYSLAGHVMGIYLGEQCKYCERVYETLEDLAGTVWAGRHEHGRLACKSCWNEHN